MGMSAHAAVYYGFPIGDDALDALGEEFAALDVDLYEYLEEIAQRHKLEIGISGHCDYSSYYVYAHDISAYAGCERFHARNEVPAAWDKRLLKFIAEAKLTFEPDVGWYLTSYFG